MRISAAAIVAATALSGCSLGFDPASSLFAVPSSGSSQFVQSYQSKLVDAGLDADDAAFIAKRASKNLAAISMKTTGLASKSTADDDWAAIGEESIKASLAAIGSGAHFPSVAEKKQALSAVTVAHFKTLVDRVDSRDLAGVLGRVSEVAATEIDETGLTGLDLQHALQDRAEVFVMALVSSTIGTDYHSNVVKTFTSGAIRGLANNPTLASQSSSLGSAMTSGAMQVLGYVDGQLTDYERGLMVREILQGVMDGLEAVPALDTTTRAAFFSDVANAAQSKLVDVAPTLAVNVADVVEIVQNKMPEVTLEPTPTPAPTPVPTATPVPTPTPQPTPPSGTAVSSTALNCMAHIGSGGTAKPTWNVTSLNQCESYCDGIANNYSSSNVSCRTSGNTIKDYPAPRTALYADPTKPISCVARVTTTNGATDYKPADVVDRTACLSYCDTVIPYGGVKVCYGNGVSIREYWGGGVQ